MIMNDPVRTNIEKADSIMLLCFDRPRFVTHTHDHILCEIQSLMLEISFINFLNYILILQFLLCICVLQTVVNDESSINQWEVAIISEWCKQSSYHLIKVTLLTMLIPFSDSDQGLGDGVCQCHHVLQGQYFSHKSIFLSLI